MLAYGAATNSIKKYYRLSESLAHEYKKKKKKTREIVEHALNPTYLRQPTMANLQGFKGIRCC
jgi:hypothetical protein